MADEEQKVRELTKKLREASSAREAKQIAKELEETVKRMPKK